MVRRPRLLPTCILCAGALALLPTALLVTSFAAPQRTPERRAATPISRLAAQYGGDNEDLDWRLAEVTPREDEPVDDTEYLLKLAVSVVAVFIGAYAFYTIKKLFGDD
mmetsp:Transcript_70052/g.194669  ORF Transcript_70052/g.194669 Transcript_70052/m.194669 type:complete len:108 (-) Transcript_70052:200-523(-)|eukprot:CAMPEP_0117475852 /NCGR_PEP_ID=MMETSP0784-20121206/10009_1 /TAXON_ID=39447 /ORGANISM="" /LENGTH=107 /DNA_ID=CAMNT_0005270113 /DNA_START=59 /DNA_END=382 /DNA_ORIENTATION=+